MNARVYQGVTLNNYIDFLTLLTTLRVTAEITFFYRNEHAILLKRT